MSKPGADAHTRYGHEVGEHLETGVNVDHSSEMAQANDDCASGHEDDEGQAHEDAMCYCHAIDFVQERDQEWGEPSGGASRSPTTSSSASLGASLSAPASSSARSGTSRFLCACDSDYRFVSGDHFQSLRGSIHRAKAIARAESFMLSVRRAICAALE